MKNWKTKTLSEICIVFEDGDWIESKDQSIEGIRLIQTGNVGNGFFKDRSEKARYISENTFKRLRCTEIVEGDCLISRLPDPVGRACIIPNTGEKMITAVDCTIIRFQQKEILPEWFLFYSLSDEYQKEIVKQITGATRQRISRRNLGQIEIPLPPLPEQQQILAILDKAFTSIAKAKVNAEQNLKNANELFESYLQSVFENKGEGWEEKALGEIADIIGGYSFKSGDFKKDGKYQVIRMGNVRPGIIRENESPVFIDKLDESVLKRALLLPNDVIITQTGTKKKRDYGFTVIIEKVNYLLNQRISTIRFPKNYLPKFFLYFSWTNLFKDQYFANETGTVGQGNVGIGAITNAIVPFLSLKTQQTIVYRLDTLFAETKKLENIYQRKINDLEEFKKSILQKAFKGELTYAIDEIKI
jgi:type I restriction enzyme, S subunit